MTDIFVLCELSLKYLFDIGECISRIYPRSESTAVIKFLTEQLSWVSTAGFLIVGEAFINDFPYGGVQTLQLFVFWSHRGRAWGKKQTYWENVLMPSTSRNKHNKHKNILRSLQF